MRKTTAIIMMLAATTVSAESLIITTPDHTLSMYGCRVNASWYVQGPTPGRAFGDGRSYQRCMVTGGTARPPSTEVWCADQLRQGSKSR